MTIHIRQFGMEKRRVDRQFYFSVNDRELRYIAINRTTGEVRTSKDPIALLQSFPYDAAIGGEIVFKMDNQ